MSRGRDFREPRRRGFDEQFGWPSLPDSGGPRGSKPPRQESSFSAPARSTGPEVDATVKWFNTQKGFGFVALGDGSGDAFLHIRAVEAAGHTDMPPGAKLTVRTAQGQKGPQVTEILTVDLSEADTSGGGAGGGFGAPRSGGFGGGDRGGFGGGGGFGGPRPSRGPAGSGAARLPSGPTEEMTGTVKWYNPEKGFGFIGAEDGGKDVFIHRSVLSRAGLSELAEGQRVTVGVVESQKGREAASITVGD